MKIVFILPSLVIGGAERVAIELAKYWIKKGHLVTIITFQKQRKDFYQVPNEISRIVLPKKNSNCSLISYFKIIIEIRQFMKNMKDAFYISFLPKANIISLIASLGLKIKIIVSERNIIADPDIDKKQHLLRKLLYPLASKVSVQHSEIKEELLNIYPKIKESSVVITPNPVRIFSLSNNINLFNFFNSYNKAEDTICMAAGRFTTVKAFYELLEIFNSAFIINNSLKLILIGDGPELQKCKDYVRINSLTHVVYLPGKINPIDDLFFCADIFLNTSKYEGFPNVIAEALSVGLPVIAYDAPSIKVLVKNDINGFVIQKRSKQDFINHLLLLSTNNELRKQMSQNAKNIIDSFNIESISNIWFQEVFL